MADVRLSGHGVTIDVPDGWEARIYQRGGGAPVLHVATFGLEAQDGDFGAAATGRMRPDDTFAALVQYRTDARLRPGAGLFAAAGAPAPRAAEFGPRQLQVMRPGHLGWQRFFTERGRPCCLYAVIQPAQQTPEALVARLEQVLVTVRLEP